MLHKAIAMDINVKNQNTDSLECKDTVASHEQMSKIKEAGHFILGKCNRELCFSYRRVRGEKIW